MPGTVGSMVFEIERWAGFAVGVLALGVDVWALVDALTRRSDAFPAVNRLTKVVWVVILAVASLVAVAVLHYSVLLSLVALGAGLIYLLDTRPKIREITGTRHRSGPYGPW